MANSKIVMGIDDLPMWQSIDRQGLELQCCDDCATFRYPPAPLCPTCLSLAATWTPVAGTGTVLSWVVFHKKYFDDHHLFLKYVPKHYYIYRHLLLHNNSK